METHPAANVIRMMTDEEYSALRDDIEKRGLLQPIVLCEDMILDGRNRHKVCMELGIPPTATKYSGGDPVGYVKSLNVKRRHLTKYEQVVEALKDEPEIKAKAKEKERARKTTCQKSDKSSLPKIDTKKVLAAKAGVSHDTVAKVKMIEAKAGAKVKQSIIDGETTINAAYKKVAPKPEKQPTPPLPEGIFNVIYADPPWKYGQDQHSKEEQATVLSTHYSSMETSDICAMDIPVATDAVLFLWATSPKLFEAKDIVEGWGFTYKTSMVWDKVKHNVGYYVSVRHEFLLICTRGSMLPESKELHDSVISIERTKHSEKPDYFRELIEKMYPNGKKLELFGRKKVIGWTVYGNDPAIR